MDDLDIIEFVPYCYVFLSGTLSSVFLFLEHNGYVDHIFPKLNSQRPC